MFWVNNAGIFLTKPFTDFTAEDFTAALADGPIAGDNASISMIYEGWVEFSNPESRNRVCKIWHSL
jgi:hypothetical protein